MPEADCFGGVSPPSPSEGQKENKWKMNLSITKWRLKKMVKENRKLILVSILLMALVISSAYAFIGPDVHAEVVTTNSTAKGLAIINEVAGFDLTQYDATPTLKTKGPTLGMLPTENIRYTLKSDNSHIEILEKFTNGRLQIIDVLKNSHSFHMTPSPAALVGMAKTFLLKYQTYSADPFYGQLASMLNKADATTNSTTTVGNIKFDITTTSGNSPMGNSTIFTWSYISNGIIATRKCVSLGYEDGFLKVFIDNWNLYRIGSTAVNLSEKQAEDIAMKNAMNYTWSVGTLNQTIVINNFNVTKPMVKHLMFCEAGNASNARDNDPLALYPVWRIGVGLDKFYPGNVYGISVDIWADTGQIKDIYELFSTLPAPIGKTATIAESSISTKTSTAAVQTGGFPAIWIAVAPFAVITMGVFPIWLIRKKTPLRLPKMRKIGAIMLCVLIGSVALFCLSSAISTVDAAVSVIWAETCYSPYLTHTIQEITLQLSISSHIDSWFGDSGYAHNNYAPASQTTKTNILYYTGYYGQVYPSVETIYFDHGIGMPGIISHPYEDEWHYMVSTVNSTYGNPTYNVFDYMIYNATSNDNNHFSYINTCLSANLNDGDYFGHTGAYGENQGGSGNIIGMPYAWTHGHPMSTDGLSDPDSGPYCYIGFVLGSAALNQVIPYPSGDTIYYYFVYDFFDALLNNQLTVNQALNYASYQNFPPAGFAATYLYNGFTAYWPGCNPETGPGRMVVYGNGDIYLGGPDYVTKPSINGPTSGYIDTPYQFSASATDPYDYQLWYTFNWGDGSEPTVTIYPVDVSHTWTTAGPKTITVTAESQNGIASDPSYHTVTINNPQPVYHTLTVGAYGAYGGYTLHPNVYIDDIDYGAAPISIQVTEDYHFVSLDTYTWDPCFCCYASFYTMYADDYTEYYNGQSVPIYSDRSIAAFYMPY
jgi:hypothetical protein